MSIFKLPDLGEGLQEADIREWHVKVGDKVAVDQPLVAVETAKAVVEVPSPQTGVIKKLYGAVGDTMDVGKPLVEFEGGETLATQTAPATDTPVATPVPDTGGARSGAITDTGTVVGAMRSSNDVV
ncbi:biotin/lipoyl-containing protein, partial [uncultured Nevskia sp.]|uniref:biotin/lipoyl-containing protein n=1 Tax=uncultured Nevskia sp. TaxID=228950 RepID=UPI0025F99DCA